MIMVEVTVPSLGRRYDFELEDTAPVKILIREMVEVICQREHCRCFESGQGLSLYTQEQETRLDPQGTLQQNKVSAGQRLILL